MKAGYTKKVNLTIGVPFLMLPMLVAFIILEPGILVHRWLLISLGVISHVLFILGCCLYAKGKGQPVTLGLLGLLSIPGLVILALFPDRHKGEDENKGCLLSFLFLLISMAIIFGLIFWLVSRSIKAKNIPDLQRKISESSMKLDSHMLSSSDMNLGARIKSMDDLIKEGEPGLVRLQGILQTLKSNPSPTKDDEVIIRVIEASLIMRSSFSSTSQTQIGSGAIPFSIVETSTMAGTADWEFMMKMAETIVKSADFEIGTRVKFMDKLINEGEPGLRRLRSAFQTLKSNSAPTKDDQIVLRRIEERFFVLYGKSGTDPLSVDNSIDPVTRTSTQKGLVTPKKSAKQSIKADPARKAVKRKK